MNNKLSPWFLSLAIVLGSFPTEAVSQANADPFVIDPNRPFVYLKLDRFGPGIPWGDEDAPFRIWFHLVNNCRVPIQIRTFAGLNGETGVMDRVIPNEKILTISSSPLEEMPLESLSAPGPAPVSAPPVATDAQSGSNGKQASQIARQPHGYESEVSSIDTILPGKELQFSLPANHLSEKWHFDIPFIFKVQQVHCCRPEEVGGEPTLQIRYDLWSLPKAVQSQIKEMSTTK